MAERFDLIVLGAGSAARDAAGKAVREHGASVALVERTRWGGSCPNVACKPTKAYLVAADLVHDVNTRASVVGIEVDAPARVDLHRVRAWKESLKRPQESWVEVLRDAGYETVTGEAAFLDASTVTVAGRELTAERILVATGSRTAVPSIPGLDAIDWIDHVSALDLDELPESLLVLGAGPVGLEFAQIFSRFGSRVTVVNHGPQIAARADAEAARELQAALEDEGIEIVLGSSVERFTVDGTAAVAALAGRDVPFARVLLAAGRAPNVEALELDRAGVEKSRRGIVVDERQRTIVPGIWAAGDVADGPQFTPVAQYAARIAVDDMFGAHARGADYTYLPTAIFTDPELAAVGLTEEEARGAGFDAEVVKHPLTSVTRSQFTGARHGLFKIVFDRASRRVLGVHVVSRGGSDVVQGLALAMKLRVTVDDLALAHHVYPSYGEGVKAAAEQARKT